MRKVLILTAAAVLLGAAGQAAAQAAPPAGEAAPQAPAPGSAAAPEKGDQAPTGAGANTSATAPGLSVGQSVKDNTGAVVGQITDLKADASGSQMATVKMGEDSFTVAASSLAVQNGSAVINLTQAQLQSMVHKPKS